MSFDEDDSDDMNTFIHFGSDEEVCKLNPNHCLVKSPKSISIKLIFTHSHKQEDDNDDDPFSVCFSYQNKIVL